MEYLPIAGHRGFCLESIKLAYGADALPVVENRVAVVQSLSGTGACRLLADFQHRFLPGSKIYIPKPTWSNHHNIWRDAGVQIKEYPYYDPATRGLAFEPLCDSLDAAPRGSVVLMHACAHNPTGVDPSREQWKQISEIIGRRGLFPALDMAYQGFASGDCNRDAQAIRIFIEDGHCMALAQSYAKNMGLYGQRIGALSVVCASKDEAVAVESQLKAIARPMYSNPPLHGALLVHTILSDAQLREQWFTEVSSMAERIINMRQSLRSALENLKGPVPWNHITDQIGMFAYSGLTPEQVDRLTDKHSIYLTRNGRISMAGVNSHNVERLAHAINEVMTAASKE